MCEIPKELHERMESVLRAMDLEGNTIDDKRAVLEAYTKGCLEVALETVKNHDNNTGIKGV